MAILAIQPFVAAFSRSTRGLTRPVTTSPGRWSLFAHFTRPALYPEYFFGIDFLKEVVGGFVYPDPPNIT